MTPKQSSQPADGSRIADYIGEHVQTVADLQTLDCLLQRLRDKQEIQRQQLREAEQSLKETTNASRMHKDMVHKQANAFNERQRDIDRRLRDITLSKSSDEATLKFEASMERLLRLDMAKGYMELLGRVDSISKEILSLTQSSPSDALRNYLDLRGIASMLKASQVAADGAAPHLVDYTTKLAETLKSKIRTEYSGRLRASLDKMKWPAKDLQLDDFVIREWSYWTELLLQLQEPDVMSQVLGFSSGLQLQETPILSPLEEMVHPLNLRFKYHFSGDRPTNRLDKPEYFLSHIIDQITAYSDFMMTYLQPILTRRSQNCDPAIRPLYTNSIFSFITALLPIAREKINSTLPQIAAHPQLLSHFVHELMQFDSDTRETWAYCPAFVEDRIWKGLTWEVLVKQDWFSRWLQVEKDFALSRYQNIIDAADAGEIDYDGVDATATKPTKAAIRVNDLLETITDRYRPLSSFSQKLRFLIDIQIAIFDLFHERLHSGLEAYLAMTSAIGRTVQGSSANQLNLEGVAGLERICRIFGSAEYLEKKMQDWGDDVFFLELWYELQDRVAQNVQTGRPVAGSMSLSEVAARTSSSVNDNNSEQNKAVEGALFDETSSAYRRIRIRSESIIVSTLTCNMQTSLKQYSRTSTWASLTHSTDNGGLSVTPSVDLAEFSRNLTIELQFLSRVLAAAPLRRVTRQLLLAIQAYLWDNILMRNTFSAAGASQFSADLEHICATIDASTGVSPGENDSKQAVQRLQEGLLLLGLPATSKSDAAGSARNGFEADTQAVFNLWEVEKRLFANNESAREVLKELGIEMLSEVQARAVLERRAELRS